MSDRGEITSFSLYKGGGTFPASLKSRCIYCLIFFKKCILFLIIILYGNLRENIKFYLHKIVLKRRAFGICGFPFIFKMRRLGQEDL